MIRDFETWCNNIGETFSIQELRDLSVVIEAADYINTRILTYPAAREPLLPAIGGIPLIMRHQVEQDIQAWRKYNIIPSFVFSGLDFQSHKDDPSRHKTEQSVVNADAWRLYSEHKADSAVHKFGESSYITAEDLFPALQLFLFENNVAFMVAPYSAWAQVAYFERFCKQFHAVAGSSELLLFKVDKIITSWDFPSGEAKYIRREKCLNDMKKHAASNPLWHGDITDDMLVDACMLAGNNILPTHPNLNQGSRSKVIKPLAALEMMMSLGKTGYSVCVNYKDDPRFQDMNYFEMYCKARAAVKHHVILTWEGRVEPLDVGNAPNNVHEFIGNHLPDELIFYLSKGVISSRFLQWRAANEIIEHQPLDGGDSEDYRKLVSSKVTQIRAPAFALLSERLHRFFQHTDVSLRCWFADPQAKPVSYYQDAISMKDVPNVRSVLSKWSIRSPRPTEERGFLGNLLRLKDNAEAAPPRAAEQPPKLASDDDLIFTSGLRLLALREYVDSSRNLTKWGEVLDEAIKALDGRKDLEEAVFVAIELLRLDVLTTRNMFPYSGVPIRGGETDRRNNLLISRVACLGRIHHKAIGFTGPLSQHLLAFHSMVDSVRDSLRCLVESTLTNLLLNNEAIRDHPNLKRVSMKLPFLLANDCALGIAIKSYLDELATQEDPTSGEAKAAAMQTLSQRYFPQCLDLPGDLQVAFKLWDAVYAGVKAAGSLVKEHKTWDEVNQWLSDRR